MNIILSGIIKIFLMTFIFIQPTNYPRCVIQFVQSYREWKSIDTYNKLVYEYEMELRNNGFVPDEEYYLEEFMWHLNPYNRAEPESPFPFDDKLYSHPII